MEQIKPILEVICNAENKEGRLAKGFKLPAENDTQKNFADGAVDGMMMYHTVFKDCTTLDSYKLLTTAIDQASLGNREEAHKAVDQFCQTSQILPMVDGIHKYMEANQEKLNAANLLQFAVELFSKGTRREEVKFGLVIIELFDIENMQELKNYLRCMGACEEFALYVAHIMSNWQNGNEEIFAQVKKLNGWGKIFTVDLLEPETEEIKNWMICQGVRNSVTPQYNALTIALKCDLLHVMRSPINVELYLGIVDIVGALLNEKPVPGISGIKNPQVFMEAFDECLIQNASLFQKDMSVAQREHIDHVIKVRTGQN